MLFHVWQQVTYLETAYRLGELRTEKERAEHLLREVRLERASLESLERIEAEARKLGLVHPPAAAVLPVLPAPQPADPQPAPSTEFDAERATEHVRGAPGDPSG